MKCIITAVAFILTASAAQADTKTVSWYVAHPEARAKVYALCQDNPGEARHVPNCHNAEAAMAVVAQRTVERQFQTGEAPTSLIAVCDQMPRLFQQANRCGPLGMSK